MTGCEPLRFAKFPGVLAQIAEAAGAGAAINLARRYGGTEISIPKNPRADSPLVKAVGMTAARAIAREIGHGRLLIPMAGLRGEGARRAEAARMLSGGKSVPIVARAVGVHERTVRRMGKRLREGAALPLFPEN
ncbi:MAG: helix-turn-helix domain-containing protein [Rhodospirillaceae bacterium]|nr:MAG: helix-turn-helix domain-containing protein [Rhodospirillaceae bacterium]